MPSFHLLAPASRVTKTIFTTIMLPIMMVQIARAVPGVNDAPVLNPAASPSISAIAEDAGPPSGAVGTRIFIVVGFGSPIDHMANVSDADNNDGDGPAVTGIAITATDTSNGTWFYSTNGGTSWNSVGPVSPDSARLIAEKSNNRLYFQPNANFNGIVSNGITFRAWDQTSGVDGSLASTLVNGGTNTFSSATDTISVTVTAVNDAPVLQPSNNSLPDPVAANAGVPSGAVGTLVSSLVDFAPPFGQLDNVFDVDGGALLGIAVITSDSLAGNWFYSTNGGTTWNSLSGVTSTNARLLAADANNRVYFQPFTTFSGAMTFRAWDRTSGADGGLGNTSVNGSTTAFSTATDTIWANVVVVPLLTIARTNTNALISWPSSAADFRLESNTDISNTNGWITGPQTRSTNGGTISVTVPATSGNTFYRLKNP